MSQEERSFQELGAQANSGAFISCRPKLKLRGVNGERDENG